MRARGLEPEEVKAEADAEEIADFMSFAKEVAQTEAEKEAEQEKEVVDMDNRGDMEQMLYMNRVAKLLKHATWDETEDKSSKKRARAEFKAVVVSGDSSAASGLADPAVGAEEGAGAAAAGEVEAEAEEVRGLDQTAVGDSAINQVSVLMKKKKKKKRKMAEMMAMDDGEDYVPLDPLDWRSKAM